MGRQTIVINSKNLARLVSIGLLWLGTLPISTWAQGSRFAVRFHGTGTGQIDRIKIPLATAPAINVGHDLTIDFWMRAEYSNNAGVVETGQNGDGWITGNVIIDRDVYGPGDYGDFGIAMGRLEGSNVLAFGVHNGDWGETIVGSTHVGNGRWHHIAVTRHSLNGLMRLWVDGFLDAEAYGPTGNISYRIGRDTDWPDSDPYWVLGAEKHDAGSIYPSYNGYLDELRIWSRVLNSNEIAILAARIVPPHEDPDLVGWFRFEEGTNQWIRDSVHQYTGTLFYAQTGYANWTSWGTSTQEVAPVASYEPLVSFERLSPQFLRIRWFALQNFSYDIESANTLSSPIVWSPVTGATNLTAHDANLEVDVLLSGTQQFFRVVGSPDR